MNNSQGVTWSMILHDGIEALFSSLWIFVRIQSSKMKQFPTCCAIRPNQPLSQSMNEIFGVE